MTTNIARLNDLTIRVNALPEKTATQRARKDTCKAYLAAAKNGNDGALGYLAEMLIVRENSHKVVGSSQNKHDDYVKMLINGKIQYIKAEKKTNGGRIGRLLDGSYKPKFIIYEFDVCNSGTSYKRRVLPDLVFKTEDFLLALARYGKIKSTNGKNPEPAIEPTSKTWYEFLCDYPLTYDPDTVYTPDDFEDFDI